MTQIRNFILNNEVPDLGSSPTRTPPPHPHRPTYRTTGATWGPKKPQEAPGARNAQMANKSVIEKYHLDDWRPKLDLEVIWGPKEPQGASGARNAQVANSSVMEKYHFGDRRPKSDLEAIWGPKSPREPQEPEMLRLLMGV